MNHPDDAGAMAGHTCLCPALQTHRDLLVFSPIELTSTLTLKRSRQRRRDREEA